jgi:hypothetical protein
MKRQKQTISTNRRDFLRGTVITGTAAAVVTALPQVAVAEPVEQAQPNDAKSGAKGYQVTQHVMEYYRSARF